MDVSKYSDEEIKRELEKARQDKAIWEQGDKRTKTVKNKLFWANMIITRDEAELERRGL